MAASMKNERHVFPARPCSRLESALRLLGTHCRVAGRANLIRPDGRGPLMPTGAPMPLERSDWIIGTLRGRTGEGCRERANGSVQALHVVIVWATGQADRHFVFGGAPLAKAHLAGLHTLRPADQVCVQGGEVGKRCGAFLRLEGAN